MSDDLMQRLRESTGYKVVIMPNPEPGYERGIVADTDLMVEAADRIEALETALRNHYADGSYCDADGHFDWCGAPEDPCDCGKEALDV